MAVHTDDLLLLIPGIHEKPPNRMSEETTKYLEELTRYRGCEIKGEWDLGLLDFPPKAVVESTSPRPLVWNLAEDEGRAWMRLALCGSNGKPEMVADHDEAELRHRRMWCGDTLLQPHKKGTLKAASFLLLTRILGLAYESGRVRDRANDIK